MKLTFILKVVCFNLKYYSFKLIVYHTDFRWQCCNKYNNRRRDWYLAIFEYGQILEGTTRDLCHTKTCWRSSERVPTQETFDLYWPIFPEVVTALQEDQIKEMIFLMIVIFVQIRGERRRTKNNKTKWDR